MPIKNINTTKHFFMVLCCLFFYNKISAQQNLVPNPSFEDYTVCPVGNKTDKPDLWYKPDTKGASYLNSCAGIYGAGVPYNIATIDTCYQFPRSGSAHLLMFFRNVNLNNYIQIKLYDSLIKNVKYYGEYYVNKINPFRTGCNNQSMLFTKTAVYADTSSVCILLANPQITNYSNPVITDTLNWVKVSGIFKAQGGEQYLTLGNFRTAANTAYTIVQSTGYGGAAYYVDDVSVISLDSFCLKANAGRDTTIKLGDSVFIGSYTNGLDSVKWFNGSGQLIDSIRPGFWVKPTSSGTYMYVLQQTVNGCFSADTVWVNVTTLPLKMVDFTAIYHPPLTPPQEGNVLLQWQTANEINVSHYNIERSVNGNDFTVINKVKANNKATNHYTFTDQPTPNTQHQTWFYRIAGVDYDGRKTFSQTKTINYKPQTINVSVFPNPAKDVLNVVGSNIKEVKLFDMFGREIATGTNLRNDAVLINTKNFNKGLYIVQVILTNGITKNEKIIVQ